MPNDDSPGRISASSLLQRSQAASLVGIPTGGKSLPLGGKNTATVAVGAAVAVGAGAGSPSNVSVAAAAAAANTNASTNANAAIATGAAAHPAAFTPIAPKPAARAVTNSQSLTNALNAHLNDSGRPDQFRVDPTSSDKIIQQINPATGQVIGEFSADEFPALARSIGATGVLLDTSA